MPAVSGGHHCAATSGAANSLTIQVAMLWMVRKAVVEGQAAAISSKISAASSRESPSPPCSTDA